MINPKIIAGIVVLTLSFIFYFAIFYLVKEDFIIPIAVIIGALFAISFYLSKAKFLYYKLASLGTFVLALLLNMYLLGWI